VSNMLGTPGADSGVVNGQLLSFPQLQQYVPQGYVPQTIGVPQVSPSYPPYMLGVGPNAPTGASTGAAVQVGGYGTADNNSQVTAIAARNPWNLKVSPVPWAVGGLVLSLLLLRAIHWRETVEEHAGIGPLSERAEEGS
jgi:hypothetical protein